MKKTFIISLSLISILSAQIAIEIIDRVDKNVVANTISYEANMIISLSGQVREKKFIGYIQGKNQAYMEFTAPARDKGTRFLKLGDEMWIYVKDVEKATKIAGHMLRQSLVDSDFSYDDITSNEKLKEQYNISLLGIDTVFNRACYSLELTGKIEEVTYYKRKLWIDKEYYYPLKQELFAKSGKLMKEILITGFKKIGDKNYPTKIRMENKLRQNTYTELVLDNVKLDISLPERVFTKAYLERK